MGRKIDFSVISESGNILDFLKDGATINPKYFSLEGVTFLSNELLLKTGRLVTSLEIISTDKPEHAVIGQAVLERANQTTFQLWKKNLLLGPFKSQFQKDILLGLLKFSQNPCRVLDYSALAKKSKHEKAVRAVASVMATNPWPVIFPCHRVLPKASVNKVAVSRVRKGMGVDVGKYGGSQFTNGPQLKRSLLEAEGLL